MRVLLIVTALLAVAAVCQALRIPIGRAVEPRGRTACTTDDGLDGVCRRRARCPPARLELTAAETLCPGRRRRQRICCPFPLRQQGGTPGQPDVTAGGPEVGTEPAVAGTDGGLSPDGALPAGPDTGAAGAQGGPFGQQPWLPWVPQTLPAGGGVSTPFGGFGVVSPGSDPSGRFSLGSGGGLFFGVGPPGGSFGGSPSDGAFGSEATRGSLNPGASFGGFHGGFAGNGSPDGHFSESGSTDGGFGGSVSPDSNFAGSGPTDGGFAGSGTTDGGFAVSPDNGFTGTDSGDGGFAGSSPTDGGFAGSGSPDSRFTGTDSVDGGFAGSSSTDGGFAGSGSTDGSFAGSSSTERSFAGSSSTEDSFAGGDSADGGFPGSGSTDGGFAGSGSLDGRFGESGSTGFAESGSTGGSSTGSGSTDGGFAGSGSPDGRFEQSGSTGFAESGPADGSSTGSSSTGGGFAGSGSPDGRFGQSGSTGFAESGSTDSGFAESGSPDDRFAGTGSFGGESPNSGSSNDRSPSGGFASSRPPATDSSNSGATGNRLNTGVGSSSGSSSSGDGSSGAGFASGGGFAGGKTTTSRPRAGGAAESGFAGSSGGGGGFAGGGGSSGGSPSRSAPGRFEPPVETSSVAPAALPTECGRPTPKTVWLQAGQQPQERSGLTFDIRVIGGKNAEIGKWPWIALIGHQQGNKPPFWFCGGTLIDPRNILTAAHCLKPRAVNPATLVVRLGEYDTSSDDDGANPHDYGVNSFTNHKDFAFPVLHDDISLVHLNESVTFSETIKPICLPAAQSGDYAGSRVDVAGWGYTEFGGETSNILQEVKLPVVALPDCQAVYESSPSFKNQFPGGFGDKKLCAGEEEGGKDACQGDSGGPMVRELEDGHFEQIGVVSAGVGCGRPGSPGIYTRVGAYVDWIMRNKK